MSTTREGETRESKFGSELIELARASFREADDELQEIESEIARLKEQRRVALGVLRLVDPESAEVQENAKAKPGPKTKTQSSRNGRVRGISDDALAEVRAFIEAHADDFPTGFISNDLASHPAWNGVKGSGIRVALDALAGDGFLTLDRIGWTKPEGPNRGRAGKVYKVAANGAT
jgi:hypothetical protein